MPAGEANAATTRPGDCVVRGWRVFGPGYHRGSYYSPEMCRRIASNFARLKGHLTPSAKIGHDKQQRLAQSLGFPNVGRVTGVRASPDGSVLLDLDGVPAQVGGEIAAGRLNSGSVELLPEIPDPDDPSETVEGPVLTGVAFLGEEQPAVKGFKPPVASYADGRPVPPNADPADWFTAMAKVTRDMAASSAPHTVSYRGRQYAARVICFSEMSSTPAANMDPELEAKLTAAGLTPDEVAACVAALSGGGAGGDMADPTAGGGAMPGPAIPPTPAPTAMADPMGTSGAPGVADPDAALMSECAKYADMPDATPEQKLMGAMAKKFSDLTKRFGAMEAATEATAKKSEEAQMAAFSAAVDQRCRRIAAKVPPVTLERVVKPTALQILKAKTFSSEADRTKAFSDFFAGYESLPDDPRLANAIKDTRRTGEPGKRNLTELQKHMVRKGGLLDRESPKATAALRAAV